MRLGLPDGEPEEPPVPGWPETGTQQLPELSPGAVYLPPSQRVFYSGQVANLPLSVRFFPQFPT